MSTVSTWSSILTYSQETRHHLHQHPELGWQETQTADYIRNELTKMGIQWRVCAELGTVATLRSVVADARNIAFRADMDALPISEQTDKAWKSCHMGVMHACGHDGHTAVLLAAVKWLKMHASQLQHHITFLFQPAEEGGHGAKAMIEDGALDGIDEIYGWHNWPAIVFGEFVCPDSGVMAGNGTFFVDITGKGGHASQPDLCADPVLAAAAITLNLQQIVARRLSPQSACVVSVTAIDAPSGLTTIPEIARLSGSVRFSDVKDKSTLQSLIQQICDDTARTYGVSANVMFEPRYQPTINHPHQAEKAREAWSTLFGSAKINHDFVVPIMASEDFSYYLERVSGAFALIGAREDEQSGTPCHSAFYDFNDHLLEKVIAWYAALAGIPQPSQ